MRSPHLRVLSTVAALVLVSTSADAAPAMALDNLTGPVTANEIASIKAFMATVSPAPFPPGSGNWMSDGHNGRDVEALGVMFEVTGDVAFLDRMIDFVEPILAARNSPATGQIMWTGKRELVWVTKAANAFNVGYAGSENGDALGHVAYCAKLILETPALWQKTVPDGDPNGFGATYFERAKGYVTEAEKTEDTYILPWFVDPTTHRFTPPNLAAWTAMNENVTAWNRQMMFDNGFQRLSECHTLLGDRPDKVDLYDAIVKASVDWFFSEVHPKGAAYDWSYGPGLYPGSIEVNEGIHATYDLIGAWQAYASCRLGVTAAMMKPFATTMVKVISLGPGTDQFYSNVDGTGPVVKSTWESDWIYLAAFDPAVYTVVTQASVASGRAGGQMDAFAAILAVKNALAGGTFPDCTAVGDAGAPSEDAGDGSGGRDDGGTDSSTTETDAGGGAPPTSEGGPGNPAVESSGSAGGCGCEAGPRGPCDGAVGALALLLLGLRRRRGAARG